MKALPVGVGGVGEAIAVIAKERPFLEQMVLRDFDLERALPDPAHLGEHMHGKTGAGTWVKGMKDGAPREVYLYPVADKKMTPRT